MRRRFSASWTTPTTASRSGSHRRHWSDGSHGRDRSYGRDGRYWRLLAFGCWLSFFNGVTQSIQFIYPDPLVTAGLFSVATR